MKNWFLDHKLGALEVLLAFTLYEVFTGTRLTILLFVVFTLIAWFAKAKFNGEFSLRDVGNMVKGATVSKE